MVFPGWWVYLHLLLPFLAPHSGRDIVILNLDHNILCYSLKESNWLVRHLWLHICREQRFITKQIFICYLGHYVDARSNVIEGVVEYSLSNSTLDHRYARIILLSKKWWTMEVVILRSECVDHVDIFFLWLLDLVLPPSLVVLLLGHCCFLGQVCLLWTTRRL
jgi:hypothetical protein